MSQPFADLRHCFRLATQSSIRVKNDRSSNIISPNRHCLPIEGIPLVWSPPSVAYGTQRLFPSLSLEHSTQQLSYHCTNWIGYRSQSLPLVRYSTVQALSVSQFLSLLRLLAFCSTSTVSLSLVTQSTSIFIHHWFSYAFPTSQPLLSYLSTLTSGSTSSSSPQNATDLVPSI